MQFRPERLAHQIQQDLAGIITHKVKDPRVVGLVSITRVEMNRDSSLATIYVSVFGEDQSLEDAVEGLNSAKGFIRRELGNLIKIRSMPDIRFREDRSMDNVYRVEEILDNLRSEDGSEPADSASDSTTEDHA